MSVAVASTSSPSAEGFICVVFISVPTVVEPSGKNGATAFMAAFSISATIDGVANTLRPPDPTADAQLSESTTTLLVYVNPALSIIIKKNICYTHAKIINPILQKRKRAFIFVIRRKKMKQETAEFLSDKIRWLLSHIGVPESVATRIDTIILFLVVLLMTFVLAETVYKILHFAAKRIQKRKNYLFLDKLISKNRLRKQVFILPPVMLIGMLPFMFDSEGILYTYTERAVWIYFIVAIVIAVNALLGTIGESVFTNRKYHDRPIKGFIQISKIIVYLIAAIIVISVVTGKSPVYLIGGLGAFAAVLMLISKDSIMGFVGGFLLLENDMVRLGDWIEMPGTSINGNVIDISLTIVKVRNWDNTIATVPPYSLINESFINWRGMSESGGRRIARGYTMKLDSIKPCNEKMLGRVKRLNKDFAAYITEKIEQKLQGKASNTSNPAGLANGTIDTNAGLFRAYADIYLHQHPLISKEMLIMVRTLEPKDSGLPIQFYCFTTDTDWSNYESIQSEIMEHFASVMPLFELYPYQSAGARDTVISGLLEGQYPLERIEGMPYKTLK